MQPNKKRRTRKIVKSDLSAPMKYFLESGDYLVKDRFPGMNLREWIEIFQYGAGGYRERLLRVWDRHRDEVLADWKNQKRSGLPWASQQFDSE